MPLIFDSATEFRIQEELTAEFGIASFFFVFGKPLISKSQRNFSKRGSNPALNQVFMLAKQRTWDVPGLLCLGRATSL